MSEAAIVPLNPNANAYIDEVERLAREPERVCAYGADLRQRYELHLPDDPVSAPILLFFHGGAWISGHPGWASFMAGPLNAAGFILASAGYRLAPDHKWPTQHEDSRAALLHIVETAPDWGGDPSRIIVAGHCCIGMVLRIKNEQRFGTAEFHPRR